MSDTNAVPQPAPPVKHVREVEYTAVCEQCSTQARGAFAEFIEGGWVFKEGAAYGKPGMVVFCPGCVFGLAKAVGP